ncbi:MAG: helix-turn-helix domain-containing protein [Oligoflexales bacterium]|nr:helix-turn-helix domain-containing protein [Oligoflexales bacterium]
MKIVHKPEFDYISIDFKDEIEAKSVFKEGIIVRLDKKGNVIGIDITDSSIFFASQWVNMREACDLLGISESTMRRRIKEGKIKYRKVNNKDYRFNKADILKMG